MNPYFICFSLYSLLMMPLTLQFRLRLGKRSGYRLRFQAAGLPFVRKRTTADRRDEQPLGEREVAHALAETNLTLARAALSKPVLKSVWRSLRWRELRLHALFSFSDAAQTALCFRLSSILLQALSAAGALPPAFACQTELDFGGRGTEVLFQGIVTFRLGSLLPAAALFIPAYLRAGDKIRRGEQRPEAVQRET